MTFREKIQQERPECVAPCFDGGVAGCPSHYGLASRASEEGCDRDCAACWDRETETDAGAGGEIAASPQAAPRNDRGSGQTPLCLTCPAAYWESGPRGYDMLRCSLGGIREESGTPIVYINDTRLAPPAPESSAAPAWCKRRLGLDLCR